MVLSYSSSYCCWVLTSFIVLTFLLMATNGFVKEVLPQRQRRISNALRYCQYLQAISNDDWVSLAPNDAVRKHVIQEGEQDGDRNPENGDTIVIKYIGTLMVGEDWWSVDDVVECWLQAQQGMEGLGSAFREHSVNGNLLLDPDQFTEDFCTDQLAITNKLQGKKLIMAARRLQKVRKDFPLGTIFDSNDQYELELGKKRIIRGMELGVKSMTVGEKAELICRADYAYGAEGLRKRDGTVLVPPFATLSFNIELLECHQ